MTKAFICKTLRHTPKTGRRFLEITKALLDSRERCSDSKCVDEWYDTAFRIYGAIKETGIPETNGVNDILKNEGVTKPSEINEKPIEITHNAVSQEGKGKQKDFSLYDLKDRAALVEHNAILYKDSLQRHSNLYRYTCYLSDKAL